ncbi:hypothetical protein ACWDUX_30390 [Streptomyces sp. NPDC003444]
MTFSGHRTPCRDGLSVLVAEPVYDSQLKDVSCEVCGAYVFFDMEAARIAAQKYLEQSAGTKAWDGLTRISFAEKATERAAGIAYRLQRDNGSWNSNHAFSELMAESGLMTDKSAEAGLIGMTMQAVFAALGPRVADTSK